MLRTRHHCCALGGALRRSLLLIVLLGVPLSPVSSTAQDYPQRTVTIATTVSAGGSIDTIARKVASGLGEMLGGTFIVEPRPGAGGNLAAGHVARAPADGYTLLIAASSTLTINPHIYNSLPFTPGESFKILALPARVNQILVVNPKHDVKTIADFVAKLKKEPGKLSFGSSGIGSLSHLAGEVFGLHTGTSVIHVPYRGITPAMTDLLAGQIDFMFDSATAIPNVKDGKLRALAVVGPKRLSALPDVPTLAELGIENMEFTNGWYVMALPGATPEPLVAKLNSAITEIMKQPSTLQLMGNMGLESTNVSLQDAPKMIEHDRQETGAVIRRINIKKF